MKNSEKLRRLIFGATPVSTLILFVFYILVSIVSFPIALLSGNIYPVFPAAGLAFAMVLLFGRRGLMGICIGSFFVNAIYLSDFFKIENRSIVEFLLPLLIGFLIAIGATFAAGIGGYLVRRYVNGVYSLDSGENVLLFVSIGVVSCVINSTTGVISLSLGGFSSWEDFWIAWQTWLRGDAIGLIVFAPFILVWFHKPVFKYNILRILELSLLIILIPVLCIHVFSTLIHDEYLVVFLLLWAAYRFGMRGVATVSVAITIFSSVYTSLGMGPFMMNTSNETFLLLQIFLGINVTCGLFLAGLQLEQKRTEKELYKNQAVLQSTIESPKDISIYSVNRKYEYLSFNELHGLLMKKNEGVDIKIGIKILDCISDEKDRLGLKAALDVVFRGGNWSNVIRSKDSGEYWEIKCSPIVSVTKEITGATVLSLDITERIRSEEILRLSEQKYRTIFENVQDVFFQTDLEGVLLEISPSVNDSFGYDRGELIGSTVFQFYLNPEDRVDFIAELKEKRIIKDYQLMMKTKTGEILHVSVNAQLLFDANGDFDHIDGVLRDLTESKKNEIEIANKNLRLQIQNKELEQFTYIVSHDLQEPLHTLKAFSEVIKEEFKDEPNDNLNQYLKFILQSSYRMEELLLGLLHYSRIGSERKLIEVDCNLILKGVLLDMDISIKESKAEVLVSNLPNVKGIPIELAQVFRNLIDNALKFKKKDVRLKIKIEAKKEGPYWMFIVDDNGIGIDEKDKDKIFIIFKRLHDRSKYSGTGIGLAHCKKIIELHGGSIWMESKEGKGSTFKFLIPNNN